MILVEVYKEKNKKTGFDEIWISHGINTETGQNVVMEQMPLSEAPYVKYDPDHGYILIE